MKKYLVAAALALSLGGCASLQTDLNNAWGIVTDATVPTAGVIVAGNSFDALETVATSYLSFCKANRSMSACATYPAVRADLVPAVKAAQIARNNLEAFLVANPGQLGTAGLYNALQAAIST